MEFYKETEFRETEIGRIPKDWSLNKLGNIADFKNGINFGKNQKGKKGILTIDVLNMYSESIYLSFDYLYRVHINMDDDSSYLLKKGDVLFVRSSFKREGAAWASLFNGHNEKVTFCGFIIRARINNSNVSPEFLAYYLRSDYARETLLSSSGQVAITNINQESLSSLSIPVFSRAEQEKIASFLLRIDSLIQQTDDVIRKTQELKKGLMQELLTRGIGHKEFKYSEELGCEIPKEWKIEQVFEICHKPEYGYTQSATDNPIGPKFLRITDIQDGKVEWDDVPFCLCPASLIDKYKLKSGDILFARTGATTGKSYIIGECPEAIFASYLIRIRTKEEIMPEFLFYFFNSKFYWDQIKKKMGGSAQGGMNASLLSELMVHVPSKEEQKSIVSILAHIDKKIDEEKQTKTRFEEMKKGLMQSLLTGQVRIKVN